MEHAHGGILGMDADDDDVAAFLDRSHERPHRRLDASALEGHLVALVAEQLGDLPVERLPGDIERTLDAAFARL